MFSKLYLFIDHLLTGGAPAKKSKKSPAGTSKKVDKPIRGNYLEFIFRPISKYNVCNFFNVCRA
jgi:hypothetical protein